MRGCATVQLASGVVANPASCLPVSSSFSRFRIISVDEGELDGSSTCSVYPIDTFGSYNKAMEWGDWGDAFAIQKVQLSSVFEYGTWLGQGDVNGNLGSSVVPRVC